MMRVRLKVSDSAPNARREGHVIEHHARPSSPREGRHQDRQVQAALGGDDAATRSRARLVKRIRDAGGMAANLSHETHG